MPTDTPVSLLIAPDLLRPLVREVVEEVLARLEEIRATLPGERLAYGEAEAARLIGLNVHQLRDERLRGRVQASRIVGGRIAYLKADLQRYLMERRISA